MKSPKDMEIIQIEVTNACVYACSNCTRMCGHHEKTFMMDFETFKRAVDSLEGYGGSVSMMGGEPTLHPEFEKFALYLKSKYPHLYEEETDRELLQPLDDFMKTVQDVQMKHTESHETTQGEKPRVPAPCLFSMVGKTYLKHYELIQDVFKRQVLNDHSNEMFHQPALISRKDLGIDDETFYKLRDKCWIQNTWSASITPKGAFFCEIAGALDMVLGGEGGWPIEKDWWKREPKDFKDQLHWCDLCGFACETFTRDANESIDDVSETLYEKLKKVNSPKVKAGKVNVIEVTNGVIAEKSKASEVVYSSRELVSGAPYVKYLAEKFDTSQSVLHPEKLVAVVLFDKEATALDIEWYLEGLKSTLSLYRQVVFLFEGETLWGDFSANSSKSAEISGYFVAEYKFGEVFNKILQNQDKGSYIIVQSSQVMLNLFFLEKFKASTPNTGTLITSSWTREADIPKQWVEFRENAWEKDCFVGIFHQNASSFRTIEFERRKSLSSFADFVSLWSLKKNVPLDEHLFVYSTKEKIHEGERCAIFGGGIRASDIYYLILKQKGTCVAVVDSDQEKQGQAFEHLVISSPDSLKELDIDRVLIGSPIYYQEMKEKLLELGFSEEKISEI